MKGVFVSDLEDVMSDLSELIQDEGLTVGRFMKFGTNVMQVLGTDDPLSGMSIVGLFVLAMGDDNYAVATRYALGVFNEDEKMYGVFNTPWGPQEGIEENLTFRRTKLIESGRVKASEATLRRWEKVGLKTLAGRIIEEGKRSADEEKSEVVKEVKLLRREVRELKQMIEQLLKLSR